MNNEIDLKIFEALNILRKNRPHLFTIVELVNIEADSDKIPTAGVFWDKGQKKFKILIGKKFTHELDALNFSAVLEHELLHILFDHLFDETMPNKTLANIAMDSIINDSIELFKTNKCHAILDSRVKLKEINKDFSVSKNTSLDVYKFLEKQSKEKLEKLLKESQNSEGQGLDSHDGFSNNDAGENEAENSTLSDSMERDIARALIKNVIEKNEGKFQGLGNAEIDRIVKERLKTEYNFKSLFQNSVKKTLRDETKKSWKKISRRMAGIIKGEKKSNIPKVLLVVDTSGSINDKVLAQINWQIDYLSKYYSFTVVWGDEKLEGHEDIKKGKKVNIEFSGGGGTNLNFYYDIQKKENFDLIIFDTDGLIPPLPRDCTAKKLFCIYGEYSRQVGGYKNIDIK